MFRYARRSKVMVGDQSLVIRSGESVGEPLHQTTDKSLPSERVFESITCFSASRHFRCTFGSLAANLAGHSSLVL